MPPNASNFVESFRSIGYSFNSAVADLIDNSISANATNIDILYSVTTDGEPCLIILDNGKGMSKNELKEAMRFGSNNPLNERDENDLGRFGLGMKSASLSQCREFTVVTKQGNDISAYSWNLDIIIQDNDWSLVELSNNIIDMLPFIEELKCKDSGTYLIMKNFDKIEITTQDLNQTIINSLDDLHTHLELTFHRFIQEGIVISINYNEVKRIDPFLQNHSATYSLRERKIYIDGKVLTAKPYILPHISKLTDKEKFLVGGIETLKRNQGFYIYRNKRLIEKGTWFNLERKHELNKLARIMVDIPNSMDYLWNIDVKKSRAVIPSKIKRKLIEVALESVCESSKVESFRSERKNTRKDVEYIWNRIEERDGTVKYKVNRDSILVKENIKNLKEEQKFFFNILLKNLEENIPIHSMYVDNANGKVSKYIDDNLDDKLKEFDIIIRQKEFLNEYQKKEFIKQLLTNERFNSDEIIEEVRKRYL